MFHSVLSIIIRTRTMNTLALVLLGLFQLMGFRCFDVQGVAIDDDTFKHEVEPFTERSYSYKASESFYQQHVLRLREFDFRLDADEPGVADFGLDLKLYASSGSSVVLPEIFDRTMFYFMACNDSEYQNLFGGTALSTTKSFCTNGQYLHTSACQIQGLNAKARTLSHVSTPSFRAYSVHQELQVMIPTSGRYHFLVTNCEILGGTQAPLRSCVLPPPASNASNCYQCDHADFVSTNDDGNGNDDRSNCTKSSPKALDQMVLDLVVGWTICNSGKHSRCLSAEHAAAPLLHVLVSVIWGLATLVWTLLICVATSRGEAVVELQKKMAYVPASKTLVILLSTWIWFARSQGAKHDVLQSLQLLYGLVVGIEHYYSAMVLMLIAKGWKITRSELEEQEQKVLYVSAVFWAFAWSMVQMSLGGRQSSIVAMSFVFCWFWILHIIWTSTNYNRCILVHQLELIDELTNIDAKTTPVYTKLYLFRKFQYTYSLYLFCSLMSMLFYIGLANINRSDFQFKTSNILDFLLYFAIGFTFRCRRFRNHLTTRTFRVEEEEEVGRSSSRILPTNNHGQRTEAEAGVSTSEVTTPQEEWSDGMELPSMKSTAMKPKRLSGKIIVVVNPDSETILGESSGRSNSTRSIENK